MRRKDREVTDINDIVEIIRKCDSCRLALFDDDYPYIIPMNFGFSYGGDKITLYFHGASEGKKLDLIRQNNHASFEMDCSHKLITGDKACDYTMEYESVCGSGEIQFLLENEKLPALEILMKQYSNKAPHEFSEHMVRMVTVFKLEVNQVTGKRLKLK